MSNTLEIINNRFTARAYLADPLPTADIQAIGNAGLHAPSSMNRQRWEIIALTNAELIAELDAEALLSLGSDPNKAHFKKSIESRGGKVFYDAPAIFMVYFDTTSINAAEDKKEGTSQVASTALDVGILVENMALAATALGYGNCICGLMREALRGDKREYFEQKLGVSEGYEFGIALLVGKTDREPTPHQIKPEKLKFVK